MSMITAVIRTVISTINMIPCGGRATRRHRGAWLTALPVAVIVVSTAIVGCSQPGREDPGVPEVAGPVESDPSGIAPPPVERASIEVAVVESESEGRPDPAAVPVPGEAGESETEPIEPPASPRVIELEGGVRAWVGAGRIEFPGEIALEEGWLEVAVCRRSTREHESIVVADVTPSVVHAAMLLAGFEPGAPATWDPGTSSPIPPRGPLVTIELRFGPSGPDGDDAREVPLDSMIEDARGRALPRWVFAGSLLRPNPPSMGEGEYFLADYAGTFVGLTTFGDEVIAAEEVRSPETGVDPPVWRIREGSVPPLETPVIVVVRRFEPAPE